MNAAVAASTVTFDIYREDIYFRSVKSQGAATRVSNTLIADGATTTGIVPTTLARPAYENFRDATRKQPLGQSVPRK